MSQPVISALGGLSAVLAVSCAVLAAKLAKARRALASAEEKLRAPPPAPPPRLIESRREHFGLLWFAKLTVNDEARIVLSATPGLPHCARCVRVMTLNPGPPEEWACDGCSEKRPGSTADIRVMDTVTAEALREFLRRHPGYRPAPGLPAPKA